MKDDNWEIINGEPAHEIEVLNYANQVNVIEALVHVMMHLWPAESMSCAQAPDISLIREFHRTATLFLLRAPGSYRDIEVFVGNADVVIHTPPTFDQVDDYMKNFHGSLVTKWANGTPQEIGAFCLWMINWVHPFRNGNGRTARAFAYACICLKIGFTLPGKNTIIDMIMDNRPEYYAALKVADNGYTTNGEPDLEPLIAVVDRFLNAQLAFLENEQPDSAAEQLP